MQCELSLSCSSRWARARARGRASQSGRSSSSSSPRLALPLPLAPSPLNATSSSSSTLPPRSKPASRQDLARTARPFGAQLPLDPRRLSVLPTSLTLRLALHSTAAQQPRTLLLHGAERPSCQPRPTRSLLDRSTSRPAALRPSLSSHTARHSLILLAHGTTTPYKSVGQPERCAGSGGRHRTSGRSSRPSRIDPRSALAPPLLAQSGSLSPLDRLRDAVHRLPSSPATSARARARCRLTRPSSGLGSFVCARPRRPTAQRSNAHRDLATRCFCTLTPSSTPACARSSPRIWRALALASRALLLARLAARRRARARALPASRSAALHLCIHAVALAEPPPPTSLLRSPLRRSQARRATISCSSPRSRRVSSACARRSSSSHRSQGSLLCSCAVARSALRAADESARRRARARCARRAHPGAHPHQQSALENLSAAAEMVVRRAAMHGEATSAAQRGTSCASRAGSGSAAEWAMRNLSGSTAGVGERRGGCASIDRVARWPPAAQTPTGATRPRTRPRSSTAAGKGRTPPRTPTVSAASRASRPLSPSWTHRLHRELRRRERGRRRPRRTKGTSRARRLAPAALLLGRRSRAGRSRSRLYRGRRAARRASGGLSSEGAG